MNFYSFSWLSGFFAGGLEQSHNDTSSNQAREASASEIPDQLGNATNNITIKRAIGFAHENCHDHAKSKQTNRNARQSSDRPLYRTDDVTHHILHRKKTCLPLRVPSLETPAAQSELELNTDPGTALRQTLWSRLDLIRNTRPDRANFLSLCATPYIVPGPSRLEETAQAGLDTISRRRLLTSFRAAEPVERMLKVYRIAFKGVFFTDVPVRGSDICNYR